MDEEDIVDPRFKIADHCRQSKCKAVKEAYDACVERIQSDETGEANCAGQYFDVVECVDGCVAKQLFKFVT